MSKFLTKKLPSSIKFFFFRSLPSSKVLYYFLLANLFLKTVEAQENTQDKVISAICHIKDWIFTLALVVGIIFLIVAALQYMTSGGSSEKISKAHSSLLYGIIGLAVALLSASAPSIVEDVLNAASSESNNDASNPC